MKKTVFNVQTGESTIVDLTSEEIAKKEAYARDVLPGLQMEWLREKRNNLLAETDYFAMQDVVMSDEMRVYRQALRDLPANTEDPANPVWPIKPE